MNDIPSVALYPANIGQASYLPPEQVHTHAVDKLAIHCNKPGYCAPVVVIRKEDIRANRTKRIRLPRLNWRPWLPEVSLEKRRTGYFKGVLGTPQGGIHTFSMVSAPGDKD